MKLMCALGVLATATTLTARSTIAEDLVANRNLKSSNSLAVALERDPLFADVGSLPEGWQEHPLGPALEFAYARHLHIRETVRDFTCILVKRERIRGRLSSLHRVAFRTCG